MEPAVRFEVWSDYLCPWCYNASLRLQRLETEQGGTLRLIWRSFLLRPHPRPRGDGLERFRAYTQSWLRPAAEEDAGEFRPWQTDVGPPTSSLPPHQVAKAAARLGDDAFRRVHDALLRAYFAENRDISEPETLRAIWQESGLAAAGFDAWEDPALREQVLADHQAALEAGATGVPAVRLEGNPAVIVGAHPLALYRRWIERVRG